MGHRPPIALRLRPPVRGQTPQGRPGSLLPQHYRSTYSSRPGHGALGAARYARQHTEPGHNTPRSPTFPHNLYLHGPFTLLAQPDSYPHSRGQDCSESPSTPQSPKTPLRAAYTAPLQGHRPIHGDMEFKAYFLNLCKTGRQAIPTYETIGTDRRAAADTTYEGAMPEGFARSYI